MMASLCLALALVSDPLAGRLCGKGPTPPDGYSPPLISNGDLNMLVEWTGGQSGRAYNQMRTTVYWQGRRGPARDAELFAFGRFNPTMVVEGKAVGLPAAWSQTLDVRQALVTCVGAFAEGLEATTEVFCALDRNVVAIRRTVANTSGKPLNLTLDLAYTIEPHSRLVGAWTKQDRYFETSPYVRMRGIWEEPNTDVRRVFHGLTYGQNVIGFDIAVTACDGGLIRRDVALAPGAKTSHAWFVTYSDTYEKTPTAIPQTNWDGLFATHAKFWAGYWAESFVRLPDAKLQRMYDVQQYHLRCNATRWASRSASSRSTGRGSISASTRCTSTTASSRPATSRSRGGVQTGATPSCTVRSRGRATTRSAASTARGGSMRRRGRWARSARRGRSTSRGCASIRGSRRRAATASSR